VLKITSSSFNISNIFPLANLSTLGFIVGIFNKNSSSGLFIIVVVIAEPEPDKTLILYLYSLSLIPIKKLIYSEPEDLSAPT